MNTISTSTTTRVCSFLKRVSRRYGFGRSVLLDKDNNIVGGNGVTEQAIKAGAKKVRIIETDGTELIAVKRTDLTLDSEQGRKMALADNSVANVNLQWNEEELQKAQDEWGLVPEEWGVELPDLDMDDEKHDKKDLSDNIDMEYKVETTCVNEREQEYLYNRLISEGYQCRILTL